MTLEEALALAAEGDKEAIAGSHGVVIGDYSACEDQECSICGVIACVHNEPFHFHHDGCPAEAEVEGMVGLRVYHRRADLFGKVLSVDGAMASVKYEWPYDPAAEARVVPVRELVSALEVEQ